MPRKKADADTTPSKRTVKKKGAADRPPAESFEQTEFRRLTGQQLIEVREFNPTRFCVYVQTADGTITIGGRSRKQAMTRAIARFLPEG